MKTGHTLKKRRGFLRAAAATLALSSLPIAGDDAKAIASSLVRDIGYEPVLVGPLAMGKHLVPRTPLAGERTADEIRRIAATLN